MLGALVVHAVVEDIVEDEGHVPFGANSQPHARKGRVTSSTLVHIVQVDEEGDVATWLLREVAQVEQVVMSLVLLAWVIAHHLQGLELMVLIAREGRDARADALDGPVGAGTEHPSHEGGRVRGATVRGDRAHRRAREERLGNPQDLRRLLRCEELAQKPHPRRGEHLHYAHRVLGVGGQTHIAGPRPRHARRLLRHVDWARELVLGAPSLARRRHATWSHALPRQRARRGALRGKM